MNTLSDSYCEEATRSNDTEFGNCSWNWPRHGSVVYFRIIVSSKFLCLIETCPTREFRWNSTDGIRQACLWTKQIKHFPYTRVSPPLHLSIPVIVEDAFWTPQVASKYLYMSWRRMLLDTVTRFKTPSRGLQLCLTHTLALRKIDESVMISCGRFSR